MLLCLDSLDTLLQSCCKLQSKVASLKQCKSIASLSPRQPHGGDTTNELAGNTIFITHKIYYKNQLRTKEISSRACARNKFLIS